MLHDESFAIGLAVGRKMGGSGDGVTMSDRLAGLGTLVDIWTIPRYDDPTVENPTKDQRTSWDDSRIKYCVDIMQDLYGISFGGYVEATNGDYYRIKLTLPTGTGIIETAKLEIFNENHDTKWHRSESYLIVSAATVLIVYKDGSYDFPIVLGGFVQDVQLHATENAGKYSWKDINSGDVFPENWGSLRTPRYPLESAGDIKGITATNYHYPHDELGEGHLAKDFYRLTAYSNDDFPPLRGYQTTGTNRYDILPTFGAFGTMYVGYNNLHGIYMYVGGYSETWQEENGDTGWRTTSFWIHTLQITGHPNINYHYMACSPHWCGIYPSKLCTYPHNKDDTDTSPGSYGDGLEDGYQDGYEAGEEAGQASG